MLSHFALAFFSPFYSDSSLSIVFGFMESKVRNPKCIVNHQPWQTYLNGFKLHNSWAISISTSNVRTIRSTIETHCTKHRDASTRFRYPNQWRFGKMLKRIPFLYSDGKGLQPDSRPKFSVSPQWAVQKWAPFLLRYSAIVCHHISSSHQNDRQEGKTIYFDKIATNNTWRACECTSLKNIEKMFQKVC